MNYYEHHIGDYAEATGHLSFVEDAAYSRMIRKYYAQEKPLPADLKATQRLVGARTKEEKSAVETVLQEFFILKDDGWHNFRCDAEIEKYLDGEPEREVKKANETNRLKRHREERALLFKRLTDAGQHAAWNISITELRELVKRLDDTPETFVPPLPETAPATPATATQTPDTNHQTPVLKPRVNTATAYLTEVGAKKADGTGCTPGEISMAMRAIGVNGDPGDMRLKAISAQGVTLDTVQAACQEAKRSKSGQSISPGYIIAIIERWAKEAAALQANGAKPPPSSTNSKDASRAAAAASIGLGGQKNDIELNTIDGQFRALD